MTILEIFAVFGVPSLLLAIGVTALLVARSGAQTDAHPGE
jgi:hypothetical protein